MTFHLTMGPGLTLLSGDNALIKSDQRQSFEDARHLLEGARSMLDAAERGVADARAAAVTQVLHDAQTAARDHLAERLDSLTAALEQENARRGRDVAAAAFAAVRAMLGTFADDELTARLAERAIGQPAEGETIRVEVAPDLSDAIADRLADRPGVTVVPNPDLPPAAVRLSRGGGTLIADVDVQLATLAQRWGVTPDGQTA